MNKFKSLFMTVLAVLAMVLPTTVASAQEVDTNAGGTGTITVRMLLKAKLMNFTSSLMQL